MEINEKELDGLIKCYNKTIIDLGTGDGRFVFKGALENEDYFYIGVDPSEKQLRKYSKKSVRKKLPNVIFCLGSIEILPRELINKADNLVVNLPWGSLLQNIVLPSQETCRKLHKLLKTGGELEIVFGYHQEFEPAEVERLELPSLSKEYIKASIIPVFEKHGFKLMELKRINKKQLKKLETTWSKKLAFGKMRKIFKLTLKNQ